MRKFAFLYILFSNLVGCSGSNEPTYLEVNFDFSDTQALVVSGFGFLPASNGSESNAVVTNIRKRVSDGSLKPVIFYVGSSRIPDPTQYGIIVDAIAVSPTNDIYIGIGGVRLNGEACESILLTPNGNASCFSGEISMLEFSESGDAYYPDFDPLEGRIIKKWSKNSTIDYFNATEFNIIDLRSDASSTIAPDESFIFYGLLDGAVTHTWFRYIPSENRLENFGEDLASITPLGTDCSSLGSSDFSVEILSAGKLYLSSGPCLFGGTFSEDGSLTFEFTLDRTARLYASSPSGKVYVVTRSLLDSGSAIIQLEPSFEEQTLSDIFISQFEVFGDFLYYSGYDYSVGKSILVRKSEADQTETDLLGGRNLQLTSEKITVDANGDVYFGGRDTDTVVDGFIYKYVSASGQLEQLEKIPGGLRQMVILPEPIP